MVSEELLLPYQHKGNYFVIQLWGYPRNNNKDYKSVKDPIEFTTIFSKCHQQVVCESLLI